MQIKELNENSKVINLGVEITHLGEVKTTPNGKPFQDGVVSDESGQVAITFWDDQAGKYKVGQKIMMVTGWCKSFKNELQVSSGRFGKIQEIK